MLIRFAALLLTLFGIPAWPHVVGAEPPTASPLVLTLSITRYRAVEKPVAKPPQPKALPLELVDAPIDRDGIRVMAGEPLLLNYRLTNKNARTLTINIGNALHPWLVPSMSGPDGTPLRRIPYYRPISVIDGPEEYVNSRPMPYVLKPDDSLEGVIVLTQQFALRSAGRYRLSVEMTVPCYEGAQDVFFFRPERVSPDTTVKASQRLTLIASPPSLRKQEILARQLMQQAMLIEGTDPIKSTIQALFTMSESAAMPAWEALCDQLPAYKFTWAIDEMARLCTPGSATLLGRIAANDNIDGIHRAIALGTLRAIYSMRNEIGNPALEPVIGNLLKRLEGRVPTPQIPGLPANR